MPVLLLNEASNSNTLLRRPMSTLICTHGTGKMEKILALVGQHIAFRTTNKKGQYSLRGSVGVGVKI